jgi:putative flippase GtrA
MLVHLARYGLIGAVGTAAHYAGMALLLWAGVAALYATQVGSAIGALVNYLLLSAAYRVDANAHWRTGPKFVLTALLAWFLNGLLFGLLHGLLGLSAWPAQLLVTALVFGLGFALNHYWTFRLR